MKKFLSLALAITVGSLGLISLPARAARAQEVASAGKTIGELTEEYERLLAIERDPSTPAEAREINRGFLEARRAQLRAALTARLEALHKYRASTAAMLTEKERGVLDNVIRDLGARLASLPVNAPKDAPATAQQAGRARVVKASAESAEAPAATDSASAPPPAARFDDPIVVSSPAADTSIGVDKVEIEITVNDDAIDDVTVDVYEGDSTKPFGERTLDIKRSDKGKKRVGVSLRKGINRIEVTSKEKTDAKAVRKLTYATSEPVTIGSPGGVAGGGGGDAGAGGGNESQPKTETQDAPDYDWGRVRAYFAGGVVFSKDREDFSKNDIFLDFTLDKNYLTTNKEHKGLLWAKDFNTFFDARLTSIPVAQPSPSASPTASPSPAASPTPTASPTTASTPCTTPECDNFINSKKAALMQAGIYIPLYGKKTSWKKQTKLADGTRIWERNALFIAPLFKGGIQTIVGNGQTAEADRFGRDDVFNFFSYGFMVGHFRVPTSTVLCDYDASGTMIDTDDQCTDKNPGHRIEDSSHRIYKLVRNTDYAPELLSWLTLSRGRWESFENQIHTGQKDFFGNEIIWRQRPWRYEALGRLKIPSSPMIVGFDGNFGQGPDDLRFFFGVRFDIGKLIGKVVVPPAPAAAKTNNNGGAGGSGGGSTGGRASSSGGSGGGSNP